MIETRPLLDFPRYRPVYLGGSTHAHASTLADGSLLIRSTELLEPYPRRLTDKLIHWATQAPQRVFAAERDGAGRWRKITYAKMLQRAPAQSARAFDPEGFYRTGDALKLIDPANLDRGLLVDGRVSEDFKLATGTFVSVGPLVQRVILAGAPYVLDVVVTGINRNEIGLLIFPRFDSCRTLAATVADLDASELLATPPVRGYFQALIERLAAATPASSQRIARARLLRDPPSFANGEITDKGSINQRAVLVQRAALIDELYDGNHADVIFPRPPG
jgi:hypothetical protein